MVERVHATPPALGGPHHFALRVGDLPSAERFYCEVLGLRVVRRWPWNDGRAGERSLWLSLGEGPEFLALEACEGAVLPRPFRDQTPGFHLFALRIRREDRAAWEARLGALVVHRSRFTLYVQDPEGNRVGLSHHPLASLPAVGSGG